ncbi:hypothetical protein AYR62_13690 [Secundilactobacillus paracollinoides]|uniref:Uncharacterized protein n=1 Tax=Secundilactobacillus paracollinoides TaxID=240427 RepID=A0A1B2IWR8_9LACO|nr:hypothetical protein AYR61_04385 [Secundilactobacillus paracollinoides]ANZ65025.1 hypothetical protein AYR62_13690 [Secundilactobacillus paracollinoides]ANZ66495.1 hypothetical protein AYR63_04670 [Secundilactobacillus paracollinoides]
MRAERKLTLAENPGPGFFARVGLRSSPQPCGTRFGYEAKNASSQNLSEDKTRNPGPGFFARVRYMAAPCLAEHVSALLPETTSQGALG